MKRRTLFDVHRHLVRHGNLAGARLILRLLINGKIQLGLGDISWSVEFILDQLKCPVRYSRNFNTATFYIPKDNA